MVKFLSGRGRYIFVLAILVLIGFGLLFNYVFKAHEKTQIAEKALEKREDVAMLGVIVDKLVEMDARRGETNSYGEVLLAATEFIEANYNSTFAQVYKVCGDCDTGLAPLLEQSPGIGGGKKHDPLDYPEFVTAAHENEYGSLVYWYENPEAGGRYVHMTYRWVPTGDTGSTRYLVAIGISKYTISQQLDQNAKYVAAALIIVSAVIVIGSAVLFVKLGRIVQRDDSESGGEKRV